MKKNPINNRGFTLIELLVVISIIALLSSVVLAAVSNARSNASVAAGLEFDNYNYHALGINALAYYNFNEPSGNILDSSGNNYTGTISNTGVTRVSGAGNTPNGQGTALVFDATQSGHIDVPFSPFVATPASYTVSVWVDPTAITGGGQVTIVRSYIVGTTCGVNAGYAAGDCYVLSLYGGAAGSAYTNILYGPPLASSFVSTAGTAPTASVSIPINKWTNIAYSYKDCTNPLYTAYGCYYLYINGQLVHSVVNNTLFKYVTGVSPGLTIGYNGTGQYFTGGMDNFAIYTQSLADSQIKEIYAEGLPSHTFAIAQ